MESSAEENRPVLLTMRHDPLGQHRQGVVLEGLARRVCKDQAGGVQIVVPLGQRPQAKLGPVELVERHHDGSEVSPQR